MNDLITATESLETTSYELWEKVNEFRISEGEPKIRHDQFINKVECELEDLGVCKYFAHPQNGIDMKYYDLNKDQSLLVGMRESRIVRRKVLDWIKSLSGVEHQIPQTLSQALLLASQQAEQIEHQKEQLAIAAPKVEFVDRFVESTGNKTFREVAKMLKANEREFRAFLYETKVMYQLGGGWTAHSGHIDAGRFYVTGGEANGHAYTTCKFTPKGIEYIAGKWVAHKELS